MPVANIWVLSAVVLPGGTIGQIVDQDYQAGLEEMIESGSGSVDPEFIAVAEAKPMLSFTSTAIATALGIAGLDAYEISSATDFYFKKRAFAGVTATGAVHLRMRLTKGMLCPKSVEASQGKDPAKIAYDLYPVSTDGITAPLEISTGQAIPDEGLVSELFTVGPVGLNASTLQAVQSVKWDFGMDLEHVASDGHAYATYAGINSRRPKCSIEGLDLTALDTFGLDGLALTSFKTYLRKIAQNSTRVAEGTAQHIKLSGTTGMLLPRGAKGSHGKPLSGEWNICPGYDGASAIVAISTASAID